MLAKGIISNTIHLLEFAVVILELKNLIFLKIRYSGFVWFCKKAPHINNNVKTIVAYTERLF